MEVRISVEIKVVYRDNPIVRDGHVSGDSIVNKISFSTEIDRVSGARACCLADTSVSRIATGKATTLLTLVG